MFESATSVLILFLSGLALNLTPCVYPMFSVTMALFGHRTEKNLAKSFAKASIYVLGITLTYSALGVVAALTGQIFGAALQSPFVLGGIALLMFGLAISMFGLFEFQIPSAFLNWVGGSRRAGLVGLFFSGLCVGIFAAPCIGPPIVALLAVVGQTGNPVSGFFVFFIMALGLGLPYLILGTFSSLLDRIPKSGDWLNWTKHVFGVILLGFGFFYALAATFPSYVMWAFPMTLLAGGIFLGFIDPAGNQKAGFRRFKRVAGVLALLVAIPFFIPSASGQKVVWEEYSESKISQAKADGKPVVIDFFADWCIPCHELERYTYTNKDVIASLDSFVRLKVDATNPETDEIVDLARKYKIYGVPTVLFFDANGDEVKRARLTGFAPPPDFLDLVQMVVPGDS